MLKQLRERLAALAKQMRDLHALTVEEDRGFTAEERSNWDAMTADYDDLEARIAVAERAEALESIPEDRAIPPMDGDVDDDETREIPRSAHGVRGMDEYDAAYEQFLRGNRPLTGEERELLQRGQAEMETRAQGIATDAAGGYTVPEGFAGYITETMQDFGGLYNAAGQAGGPTLLRTASGNTIPFPTNDDTGNVGEILAENTQVNEQDTVFGVRNLTAYMFSSKLIRVSLQLLQDEAVDLQAYLGNILGKRLGRAVAPFLSNGTGTAQPTGLATSAFDGGVNISAGAGITYDDLVDLEHALDPAYRRRGASWVFNDTTLRELKKIVDGNGRPLWLPANVGSIADQAARPTIQDYPYIIDQSMDNVGVGNRPIVFGDLSEFIIREVLGVNLFRFNERYMDFLQIGWMGYARWDSNLIDTQAVVTDIAVA